MKFNSEIKKEVLIIRLEGDLIGENDGTTLLAKATDAIQEKVLKCVIDIS